MIDHVTTRVGNAEEGERFYDIAFEALGVRKRAGDFGDVVGLAGALVGYPCRRRPKECPMPTRMKDLGIDRLSLEDRLLLAHEILDSVAEEAATGLPAL